jgi:hypothetical protein
MKKLIFITFSLLLMVHFTASVYGQSVEKETRNVEGFTKVSFGVPGNLYISIGPDFNVILEGDKDFLAEIETVVSGGRLVIKHDNFNRNFNKKVIVNITMPSVEGLSVSGSGQAEIKSAVKAGDLDLVVSGSGKLIVNDLTADNMGCSISGSGDVIIRGSGSVSESKISISGSGSYVGEGLKINNASINISGSGSCLCNVDGALDARVSGSGNITYTGNPRIDARVSGSGRVRSK